MNPRDTLTIFAEVAVAFAGFASIATVFARHRGGVPPTVMAQRLRMMLLFSLGCFIVVIWPTYWALGLTLAAMGVAKVIYDPAMQAHVGDVVPYAQRGKAIAFTEYSWALALLLGAPAAALAIQKWGWQSPFFWLALLAGLLNTI